LTPTVSAIAQTGAAEPRVAAELVDVKAGYHWIPFAGHF